MVPLSKWNLVSAFAKRCFHSFRSRSFDPRTCRMLLSMDLALLSAVDKPKDGGLKLTSASVPEG